MRITQAGGIGNALSRHADQAWEEIASDPKKAHIARQLFLQLCDISPDGQITRRRPQVAEVVSVTGASIAEIQDVVRVFQEDDRNFILPSAESLRSEDILDVSHEALLRQWRRFAGDWQAQERDEASELRRLAELTSLHNRGKGGLLPAQDLDRITHWQAGTSPEWAQRYVKKETWEGVLAFIEASRAAEQIEVQRRTRQRLQKRVLLWTLSIVLVAATLVLAVFSYRAETAKAAAQQALTNSYVRTIGVFDSGSLSSDELAALWELAELDPTNAKVRELVIDHWFENEVSVQRALNRDASGLRAAIGTNPELQAYTVRRAEEPAGRLVTVLEDPKETDAYRLSTLGWALAELAAKMEPKEAAAVAGRGAQRLVGLLEDPKQTNADRYTLAKALAGLVAKMEPKEAASLAGRLVTVLADPKELNPYRLYTLGDTLAGLAAKMEPKEAAAVAAPGARRLAALLEDPETSALYLFGLGQALAGLAAKLEPKEAAAVAGRGARRLVSLLENPNWSGPGQALAELAAKMEPKEAASLAGRLFTVLEDPKETNARRLSTLGETLAGLAAKLEPKEAANLAGRLVTVLEDPKETDADRRSTLAKALAGLAAKMEPEEAAAVAGRGARRLVGLLKDPKETDAFRLSALGEVLAALAAKMEPKEAAAVAGRGAQRLVGLLEDRKETSAFLLLSRLARALAELAAKMEPKKAAAVVGRGARHLAGLVENPKQTDADRLNLGQGLGALSLKMPTARQTQLLALSHMLLGQVPQQDDESEDERSGRSIMIRLCDLLRPQDLAEVLKWPFAGGEAETIVLASLEKKTGQKFGGDVWKFVEQAESLGIKDIELPAKRPRVDDALKELDKLRSGTAHR